MSDVRAHGFLIGVALILIGYLALVLGLQRRAMYPAPPAPARSPAADRPGVETVWLKGEVESGFLPARAGVAPHPVIIFAHGNGELIDFWVDAFGPLRDAGLAVMLVEYPGYGRSGGRPTQAGITGTMVAAYDHLVGRDDVDAARIVAYGRSVGGAAACALATRRPLAALVLESAFTSTRPLAWRAGVPGFLVLDTWDNLACLRAYPGPVLVLHGERDHIVPVSHARRLADAAGTGEPVLMPCGHNDCPRPWDAILDFLSRQGVLNRAR